MHMYNIYILTDYHESGFLTLQKHVSEEVVKSYVGDELPIIRMRRFPHPAWKSYEGMSSVSQTYSVIFLLAFVKLFSGILRSVAVEKETQIKVF